MKITELIATMEDVLDHMSPAKYPVGRDSAMQYAQLCADVSEKLRECASLLQMGAFAEAKKLNARSTPTIIERAKMLDFARREEWLKLCRTNHWAEAPSLSMATVRALESPENEQKAVSTETLLEQWHAVAREGSPREKLLLARKIYAANPDSQAWRTNLSNMESALIPKLLEEAKKALAEERLKDLQEMYNELISPQLLRPVHADLLEPLRKGVEKYQRQLLQEKKDGILYEIGMATARQDLDALEQKLILWQELAETPGFEMSEDESVQVNEAKSFLMTRQAEENKNKMFEEKQNELEYLLDNNAGEKDIELVWHTLKSLDMPVRDNLQTRMQDLHTRQDVDRHRRHVRGTIRWIGCAIVTIVAVVLLVLFLEHQKVLKDNCKRMEEHIAQGHPEAAVELFAEMQKENPEMAEEPEIVSLKTKAEEIIKQDAIDRQKFVDILAEIDDYLSEEKIEHSEVADFFSTAESLVEKVSAELQKQLTEKKTRRDELIRMVIDKREAKFIKDAEAIQTEMKKAYRDCQINDAFDKGTDDAKLYDDRMSELDRFSGQAENISDRINDLEENAKIGKVNVDLIKKHIDDCRDFLKSLRSQIDRMKELCEVKRQLYLPKNAEEYLQAFETLTKKFPGSALYGSFREATTKMQTWNVLMKLDVSRETLKSPEKMQANLDTAKTAGTDPYVRDLQAYTKKNNVPVTEKIRQKITNLKGRIGLWNTRNIALITEDGETYQFYVQDGVGVKDFTPSIAKMGNNRLNAFTLNVKISATDTKRITVKADRNSKGEWEYSIDESFRTGVLRDLPESFTKCSLDASKLKSGDLPRTMCYSVFLQRLNDLSLLLPSGSENLEGAKKLICDTIKSFSSPDVIPDAYERAMCLKYWSELLVIAVPGSQGQMQTLERVINDLLPDESIMYQPCARAKYAEKISVFEERLTNGIAQVDGILKNATLDSMLLEQAVLHRPIPVGVIYLNPDGTTFRLRLFYKWAHVSEELTIRINGSGTILGQVCYSFHPGKLLEGRNPDKIPLTALEQPMRKVYNGQLVFKQYESTPYAKIAAQVPANALIHWPQSWPANLREREKVAPIPPKKQEKPEEKEEKVEEKETPAEEETSDEKAESAGTDGDTSAESTESTIPTEQGEESQNSEEGGQ